MSLSNAAINWVMLLLQKIWDVPHVTPLPFVSPSQSVDANIKTKIRFWQMYIDMLYAISPIKFPFHVGSISPCTRCLIYVSVTLIFRLITKRLPFIWAVYMHTGQRRLQTDLVFWVFISYHSSSQFMGKVYLASNWYRWHSYGFDDSNILKDLSMMYRALWDRRHEGATRISQCTRRVAYPSTSGLKHDTSCLNPIMTWFIWFWYITKPKLVSEVPKREVANQAL